MSKKIKEVIILNWLSSIFSFSIGAVTIGGVLYFLFKKTAEDFISNHFQKRLEEYKHQLNFITEEKRFDYQRMLHDFNQYSSKRHEVYPEMYKLLMETKRIAVQCNLDNEVPISLKENPKALYLYLGGMGVPEEKRNELLTSWGIDKNKSLNEMTTVIFIIKTNKLSNLLTKTRDYFFSNEIFISEELAPKIENVLNEYDTTLSQLIFKVENENIDYPYSLLDEISQQLTSIRARIKQELAIGDYGLNKYS